MSQRDSLVTAVWVLAGVAVVFLLRAASPVLVPIVVGILLSYILEPPVAWLARHRIPRTAGAGLVLVAVLALLAASGYALRDQVRGAVAEVPRAAERLRQALEDTPLRDVVQALQSGAATTGLAPAIGAGAMSAMEMLGDVVVVIFLAYFLLVGGSHFCRRATELAGATEDVLSDISQRIQRFLIVRFITAVIVGLATWAMLAWMSVPQAAVWGLLAGVFNSIPYFGPVIVSGGLFVIGLGQTGDLTRAITISGGALVITSLEGWLLTPPLLGKVESMNATVVFIGLLLWTWIWGAWGALLGVPMLVVIKSVADHVPPLRPVSRLMEP